MNDLISVIIPVYNVEKYLPICLNSILSQTYKNLEIILVDDGSIDNSSKICDKYSNIDNRVIVFHQKNKGVSAARNLGVSVATGKYLTFVDSDDQLCNDAIEYLYEILIRHDADISCCNFEYGYVNRISTIENVFEAIQCYNKVDSLRTLLYQKNIDTSLWAKLYKTKLFKGIKFPIGKIYEDFGTFYKILLKIDKLVYSNQKKYIYLIRDNSIMTSQFGKKDFDMIDLSKEMENVILSQYPDLKSAVKSRILNMDFYLLRRINKKKDMEVYLNLKNDIKCQRNLVKRDKNIKFKTRLAIYLSYINIDLVKHFYNLAKKIKFLGVSNYLTKYKK